MTKLKKALFLSLLMRRKATYKTKKNAAAKAKPNVKKPIVENFSEIKPSLLPKMREEPLSNPMPSEVTDA